MPTDAPETNSAPALPIVYQIKAVTSRKNRLPLLLGGMFGAFVPTASFYVCHLETSARPAMWFLVGAGLLYSVHTVFQWARVAFGNRTKALGFVVLLEGVMVF